MEWVKAISAAVEYIESHLTEELSAEEIAGQVNISPFYFQKGFSLLCGYTVSDYIRSRRLALAAGDLSSGAKVIDTAVKYGYDSPDSFAKAFYRFHGITPSMARKSSAVLKGFAPLKISLTLKGGKTMDYRIVKKESFAVLGVMRRFSYESAQVEIPKFWDEHNKSGNFKYVCGMFGICFDGEMKNSDFDYMIADIYNPCADIPEGFVTKVIPAFTWAVFPVKGAMPDALQDVNKKIFSEWMPAIGDYEFAAGYSVEMYADPADFPKGTEDENYYTEIWVPIKKQDV